MRESGSDGGGEGGLVQQQQPQGRSWPWLVLAHSITLSTNWLTTLPLPLCVTAHQPHRQWRMYQSATAWNESHSVLNALAGAPLGRWLLWAPASLDRNQQSRSDEHKRVFVFAATTTTTSLVKKNRLTNDNRNGRKETWSIPLVVTGAAAGQTWANIKAVIRYSYVLLLSRPVHFLTRLTASFNTRLLLLLLLRNLFLLASIWKLLLRTISYQRSSSHHHHLPSLPNQKHSNKKRKRKEKMSNGHMQSRIPLSQD